MEGNGGSSDHVVEVACGPRHAWHDGLMAEDLGLAHIDEPCWGSEMRKGCEEVVVMRCGPTVSLLMVDKADEQVRDIRLRFASKCFRRPGLQC